MAESRPSMQSVQKTLIVGALVGLIFGCFLGSGFGLYYAWKVSPAVYGDGARPNEMTQNYQNHYLAMVIDSYTVNRQVPSVQDRVKSFDDATVIKALGERYAVFVANGQAVEAQAVTDLAVELKTAETWSDDSIKAVVAELTTAYENDPAKSQAVPAFSAKLLAGYVPATPTPGAVGSTDTDTGAVSPVVPTPESEGVIAGLSVMQLSLCCLGIILVIGLILLVGRRQFNRRRIPVSHVVWEGEGPAPVKQWSGTYTFGQDNYDEFFTIETLEGDFLGESGMGILEVVPGTSPKQVMAFDVGLFDKTDITTLSRVVMSEHAYNDDTMQMKIDANPQAEAVLAQPGTEFILETSALRVVATIDDLEYGEGNVYFNKLSLSLEVFVREGADLKIGEMDIPEQYQ